MGTGYSLAVKHAVHGALNLLRIAHEAVLKMSDNREPVRQRDWETLVELVNLACAEADAVRYGVCEYEHLEVVGMAEEREEMSK